jgi:plastocyanin
VLENPENTRLKKEEYEMESKDVTIARVDAICKVAPPVMELYPGDSITFHNTTDNSVSVLMSDETVFDEYRLKIEKGESKPAFVQEEAPPGKYPYAIFCREIDDFAEASSMPIVIVRPK